jgi:hypothetical protein
MPQEDKSRLVDCAVGRVDAFVNAAGKTDRVSTRDAKKP